MAVVLIVEDDVFIRQVAEIMVEDIGYATLTASDVAEALAFLEGAQSIDLLITDIRLKSEAGGGYALARQARILRPNLPVLYVTGSGPTEMEGQLVAGAHILQKPYTQDQLQGAVELLFSEILKTAAPVL